MAPAAADDLQNIREYLREHHPTLAQSTIRKLYDAARSLKKFPHRGRIGQAENTISDRERFLNSVLNHRPAFTQRILETD